MTDTVGRESRQDLKCSGVQCEQKKAASGTPRFLAFATGRRKAPCTKTGKNTKCRIRDGIKTRLLGELI